MTDAAGNSPTQQQFFAAKKVINDMMGGDSSRALGAILELRNRGFTNPLLACLDHYFNTRVVVEESWVPGAQGSLDVCLNAVYSFAKAVGIPVPQDTKLPPSPQTWLQWQAGDWGVIDGLMKRK